MISIIAVIGKNNAIGYKNKLLWNIPDDLKHFKKITSGHPVIMGRKTFESIGSPLPGRANIIITRNEDYVAENCIIAHSLKEAIEKAQKTSHTLLPPPLEGEGLGGEVFIIGGGQIYKQALPLADKLYLTIVDDEPKADTFFPDYSEFKNVISEEELKHNNIKYKFLELTK
ncbi:MAG: dihydrofolate reductase [Candidatus Falkowbacteria bacterium]